MPSKPTPTWKCKQSPSKVVQSSCSPGYTPAVKSLTDNIQAPFLILGDINAHHQQIYTKDQDDQRGRNIIDLLNKEDLGILNEDDAPTRVTKDCSSATDISIASVNIMPLCNWSTTTTSKSDHLPINISLSSQVKFVNAQQKTFLNFNKADWTGFTTYIETNISSPPGCRRT